ncbi:MAG: hypothetical protein CMJ84_01825 [Planctomycetes bacterium]|jgi:hypothetical protein|nr:hypothetical protein [Planctomycetota bacterium]MDP6409327.1 hypothetical protein [Planctomycetota bacterium]
MRLSRATTLAALVTIVALSTLLRVGTALADPNFDAEQPEGMLKSDPGLLYYITERIVEANGLPPADFRSDALVAFPEHTDLPATFTVGQEFLVAWGHGLAHRLGGTAPLHVSALWLMALSASLVAVGAYGLGRELSGSRSWGLFAAALWAATPAAYRTVGFLLVREDLSFPLFAAALWAAARAVRNPHPRRFALAGLALAAALATWHAMGFFTAVGAAAAFGVFLRTGRNPFALPGAAWSFAALPILLAVPATRTPALLLGPTSALLCGLAAAAGLCRLRPTTPRGAAASAAVAVAALVTLAAALTGGGEYAHVHEVLWAKLVHFGRLPADPAALSFDARLLWQGPFDGLSAPRLASLLGASLVAVVSATGLLRDRGAGSRFTPATLGAVLALYALLGLPAAWFVGRVQILPALLLPVVASTGLASLGGRARALGLLGLQLVLLATLVWGRESPWYRPPGRQEEIARMVAAVEELVPAGAPVACDFMNSTAILAHTRRPIYLQPKYETAAARRRAERFLTSFFHDTPAELAAWLTAEEIEHLLVDRFTLGILRASLYAAGVPIATRTLPEGSAASVFLSQEAELLEGVEGYRLLYRSPPDIRQSDGTPYDFFRLYRIEAR